MDVLDRNLNKNKKKLFDKGHWLFRPKKNFKLQMINFGSLEQLFYFNRLILCLNNQTLSDLAIFLNLSLWPWSYDVLIFLPNFSLNVLINEVLMIIAIIAIKEKRIKYLYVNLYFLLTVILVLPRIIVNRIYRTARENVMIDLLI